MTFTYEMKEYDIDLNMVFDEAEDEDYEFDYTENGVVMGDFPGIEDFEDCENVYLFYNPENSHVSVQLSRNDYTIIDDVEISNEEMDLIESKLSDQSKNPCCLCKINKQFSDSS